MHGDHEPPAAMEIIKALEQFRPWFYEEPIQFQNLPLMAEMAKKTTFPFATGERMVTKWQFRDLLTAGAAQLLQPDVTQCRRHHRAEGDGRAGGGLLCRYAAAFEGRCGRFCRLDARGGIDPEFPGA